MLQYPGPYDCTMRPLRCSAPIHPSIYKKEHKLFPLSSNNNNTVSVSARLLLFFFIFIAFTLSSSTLNSYYLRRPSGQAVAIGDLYFPTRVLG